MQGTELRLQGSSLAGSFEGLAPAEGGWACGAAEAKAGRQARARLFGSHSREEKEEFRRPALRHRAGPGGGLEGTDPIILPTKKLKPSVGKDAPRLAIFPHPVSSPLGPRHGGPSP